MSDKPSEVGLRLADIAIEAIGHDPKLAGWVLARLRVAHALDEAGVRDALDEEAFCQAAARAWCHPLNQSKVMDPDIAWAAAKEIREYIVAALRGDKP